MRTVVFEVISPAEAFARLQGEAANPSVARASARIGFPSVEAMARLMTPTRWTLVEKLTGGEPLGVRELARRLGRDVKGVHTDAAALVKAGVIDRTAEGKYSFPFDAVHVDFLLKAA
ncbi:MAG: DNA-binding protein [Candidatus Accumulibacter sp.]|jgi:predicted transcriptional regulator|nr:DNA-binding protein [Accumulibacter sp.]